MLWSFWLDGVFSWNVFTRKNASGITQVRSRHDCGDPETLSNRLVCRPSTHLAACWDYVCLNAFYRKVIPCTQSNDHSNLSFGNYQSWLKELCHTCEMCLTLSCLWHYQGTYVKWHSCSIWKKGCYFLTWTIRALVPGKHASILVWLRALQKYMLKCIVLESGSAIF